MWGRHGNSDSLREQREQWNLRKTGGGGVQEGYEMHFLRKCQQRKVAIPYLLMPDEDLLCTQDLLHITNSYHVLKAHYVL